MLGQRLGGGDAVHHRHPHVQAHDVGAGLARDGDRLAPVAGLADDLDARRPRPAGWRCPAGRSRCRRRGGRGSLPCVPRHGARDRIGRLGVGAARPGGAAAGRPRARAARSGRRDPDGEDAALPGRGLDAEVAAGQLRALAHADDAEVAPARRAPRRRRAPRSRRRRRRSSARRGRRACAGAPPRRRVGVALGVAQRLAQDPLELARGDASSSPDVLDASRRARTPVAAPQRSASASSAIGSGSAPVVVGRAGR